MSKKKAATKSVTAAKRAVKKTTSKSQPLVAPRGGVVVRMYRQGLGDCFLLAFGGSKTSVEETRYVLIDCGVHARQTNGPQRLSAAMQNILEATGGRLDVVVATHEHADHLSGFVQKESPFLRSEFTIGELWLAWTEKVGDKLADTLRRRRGTARKVITEAVKKATQAATMAGPGQKLGLEALQQQLEVSNDFELLPEFTDAEAACDLIATVAYQDTAGARSLQRFLTDEGGWGGPGFGLGAAGSKKEKPTSNELALGVLQAQAEHVEYCLPGDLLTIPGIEDVRVHVLGPPRDEDKLKKDLPTKIRGASEDGEKYKEVYLASSADSLSFALSPALGEETVIA